MPIHPIPHRYGTPFIICVISAMLRVSIPHRYGTPCEFAESKNSSGSDVSIPHRYGTPITKQTHTKKEETSQFLIGMVLPA